MRIIVLLAILIWLAGKPVFAEVILDDGFTDTAWVDLAKTTARVDTVNRCVLLPWLSLTGAVEMLENGAGYATASKEGVILHELDDALGSIAANPIYSCPWATDATGVSIRQDNLNLWAVSGDSIAYYRFNGSGMSNNPALKVSGLVDVLSVAAFKGSDAALLLQGEGNAAVISRYEATGSGLSRSFVFEPGVPDPVKISMVNTSPDFRLFTKTAAYYFMYDDSGGTYVEDPARRINGLDAAVSGSSDETGSAVLTNTDSGYYMHSDSGGASRVDVYSPGPVSGPVAVSLRPGTYEQVFLDEAGNVQWWTYDDARGGMTRISSLETGGLNLNRGYARPRIYFSRLLATAASYDAARLTVTEDVPAGTSIDFAVSTDGGVSFTDITPGSWTPVPRGDRFVLRAVLDTDNPLVTPKIFRAALEVDEDLVVKGKVDPIPGQRGRNMTISARAVRLTTGETVDVDSFSVRFPLEARAGGGPALPDGALPTEAAMAYNPASGWWDYTFTVPERTVAGRWPDDGVYLARITAMKGFAQKETELNLEIAGHILKRLIVRTVSW